MMESVGTTERNHFEPFGKSLPPVLFPKVLEGRSRDFARPLE